jgi:hypothetical protein
MRSRIIILALLSILGVGFFGGLSVSWKNLTTQQVCPHFAGLAICYIVTIAYGLMLLALSVKQTTLRVILFFSAWGTTFAIALSGSILEFGQGGVCPATSFPGIAMLFPLCYVSLLMCLAVLVLYFINRSRQSSPPVMDGVE